MRCGLHYFRFCDLRTKQCAGAPGGQVATKAIADALAGGPFTRRKVHAFAKNPSGSRPEAPGARLPSDRLVLDPTAPKPPGPAVPQAQADAQAVSEGAPQEEDPLAERPSASAPTRAEQCTPPMPGGLFGLDAAGLASPTQDGVHGGPRPGTGGPPLCGLQLQQILGGVLPTDGEPQGIRAFLGLGPGRAQPDGRPGVVRHGKTGNPTKTKGKRALNGTASQRGRKSSSLQAPSEDPRGHIQHWLVRKIVGDAATPDGTRGSPGEPHGLAPEACQFESGCGPGMQPASWRSPGVLGSSTDPPQVAAARVPAVFLSSLRGVRVPAKEARREPGGPTRRAAVGAGSTNLTGGGHPPRRPGSAMRRAR